MSIRCCATGFALRPGLVILLFCFSPAQGQETERVQEALDSRPAEGWPTPFGLQIHRIGPVLCSSPAGLVAATVALDSRDAVDVDIEFELSGPMAGREKVWALVRSETSQDWYVYGPAHAGEQNRWIVSGVRFGEDLHQGRRFVLRVAMLGDEAVQPRSPIRHWQATAKALSQPHPVIVERRIMLPSSPASQPRVEISSLNDSPVDEGHPVLAPATAEVHGKRKWPDPLSAQAKTWIYVVVHPVASERWRIFGPAEIDGDHWRIRDVAIADAGEPHWLRFQLFAMATKRPLMVGEVSYETWRTAAVTASGSIPLTVMPREVLPERPGPLIRITRLSLADDIYTVEPVGEGPPDSVMVTSIEQILEVSGEYEHLPEGASIWLLGNAVGTPIWEVLGQALLVLSAGRPSAGRPSEWRLPTVNLRRPADPGSPWRLLAVVSGSAPTTDFLDYSIWRRTALAVSETLVVEPERSDVAKVECRVSIDQIGAAAVANPYTEINIAGQPSIEGEVEALPPGASIWVGSRLPGAGKWLFSGPAWVHQGSWRLPAARFTAHGENPQGAFDVQAVVVRDGLPPTFLRLEQWRWYALAVSSVIRVEDPSLAPSVDVDDVTVFWRSFTMGTWILISLLLLTVVEWLLGIPSLVCGKFAELFEAVISFIGSQFKEIPEPKILGSTVSLIIVGAIAFLIVSYFPIYTHALETVFEFKEEKSRGLAILLIVSTGLVGIILHLSYERGDFSDSKGSVFSEPEGQRVNVVFVVTAVITLFLWCVQMILYFELFRLKTNASPLVPAAMGTAAFFIAGIETMSFYWATRLGVGTLAWIIFYLFVLPIAIVAEVSRLLAEIFAALPRRNGTAS